MKPIEKSKFYKGNPHPYDECLPSFFAINAIELIGEGNSLKFYGELVALIPDPKFDEEKRVFSWTPLVDHLISAANSEDVFQGGKELAAETIRIAYNNAARPTQDNLIFAASRTVHLKDEISEEQFSQILSRCAIEDASLIDGIIHKSKSESFRKLIAGLKMAP
jgi:hypothetical protein